MRFAFFLLLAPVLAVLHMAAGYLCSLMAGLAPQNAALQGLAKVLTFPVQQLPEAVHRTALLSYTAWFICSLLIVCLLLSIVVGAQHGFGTKGLICALVLMVLGFAGCWAGFSRSTPDWSSAGHRYLATHYLFLPQPLIESAEEKAMQYAIHENLHPGRPFVSTSNWWYWNYRSGLSGHPGYDAVAMAAQADAMPALDAFLEAFNSQRDPTLRSSAWQKVRESDRWMLETMLPNRAPLPVFEKDRVFRIYAKAPANGVWIGVLAYDRKLPAETLISILERALDSVKPMNE